MTNKIKFFMKECKIFHGGQYGHVRYLGSHIPKDAEKKIIQPVPTNVLSFNVMTIKMQ